MKAKPKSMVVTFRLETELHERLKRAAIASGQTISGLISTIIDDHLEEYAEEALVNQLNQLDLEKRTKLIERLNKGGKIKWKSRAKSSDQTEEEKESIEK